MTMVLCKEPALNATVIEFSMEKYELQKKHICRLFHARFLESFLLLSRVEAVDSCDTTVL